MRLIGRTFSFDDINNIERNKYARQDDDILPQLFFYLNDMEAETVVDENGYIHAILFCGKTRNGSGESAVFAMYSENCCKMIVRYVIKKIRSLVDKGYSLVAMNEDDELKKFHDVLFKEYM